MQSNKQDTPLADNEKLQIVKVSNLIDRSKKQIAAALPRHMTANRMARIALTEVRKIPELAMCCPLSFCGAIIQCSQLGLEPGNALGHVYLIPFWNSKKGIKEVQVVPGYRGFIDLARRSGQIISISARTVHENDEFSYCYGLNENIEHIPSMHERGELIGAYAVARLKDGGHQFEFMSKEQIDKINTGTPVWKKHYEEMARKTLVRRLFKYLPVSIEIAETLQLSDSEETGESQDNDTILIDVGVERVADDNPTPIEIDKAESAKSKGMGEDSAKGKLADQVEAKIAQLANLGVKSDGIAKRLNMKWPINPVLLPIDQLIAMHEVLSAYVDEMKSL